MGWLSSACSFIGSCISGACSVVSSAVSSIGSAMAGVAGALLKVATPYLSALMTIVNVVSKILGILNPNETPEELGDKAMRSDKTPEDFDTTQEYIAHLREEVDFDKEEFDKLSDEDKLARSAIGTAISMKAINEEKGFEVSVDTWVTITKLHEKGLLDKDNLDAFLEEFKEDQPEINEYVNDKLNGNEELEVAGALSEAYKKLEPELSTEAINDKVLSSKIGE